MLSGAWPERFDQNKKVWQIKIIRSKTRLTLRADPVSAQIFKWQRRGIDVSTIWNQVRLVESHVKSQILFYKLKVYKWMQNTVLFIASTDLCDIDLDLKRNQQWPRQTRVPCVWILLIFLIYHLVPWSTVWSLAKLKICPICRTVSRCRCRDICCVVVIKTVDGASWLSSIFRIQSQAQSDGHILELGSVCRHRRHSWYEWIEQVSCLWRALC